MENLLNCKGKSFKAVIDGTECTGKIQVIEADDNDKVFLCQDEKDGWDCDDKLGYIYSWCVQLGTPENLIEQNVANFELIDTEPTVTE